MVIIKLSKIKNLEHLIINFANEVLDEVSECCLDI